MEETVVCSARPEPFELDPSRTALIVVDMQHDFGSAGGMFARAGLNIAPIQQIVPAIATVLDRARDLGILTVFTKQEHNPDLSDAGGPASPHRIKHRRLGIGQVVSAPDGRKSQVLVRGTWNTDFVAELQPKEGDVTISKHRYSAFFETRLDSILRARHIDTLIFTGATTSVCVESSVRDATFRDYRCLVLEDCTAELIAHDAQRTNHEASLLTIELLFGWITNSASLLDALQPKVAAA